MDVFSNKVFENKRPGKAVVQNPQSSNSNDRIKANIQQYA